GISQHACLDSRQKHSGMTKFITHMSFNLKHKKVTIIGAARSGIAVANAVLRLGGVPKISESKPRDQISSQLQELDSRWSLPPNAPPLDGVPRHGGVIFVG